MTHYSDFGFADMENARNYAQQAGPGFFMPGFEVMHDLVVQMMDESMGKKGRALITGAGGGLELCAFANARPNWLFTAVDPSPQMVEAGREITASFNERIEWIEGYIPDSPAGPFDAATCLLTLHLIPDDGQKLEVLQAIKLRLKPDGRFLIVDSCFDKKSAGYEQALARYFTHARRRGIPEEVMEHVEISVREKAQPVTQERENELLREAGFKNIELFFAALPWRGWVAEV